MAHVPRSILCLASSRDSRHSLMGPAREGDGLHVTALVTEAGRRGRRSAYLQRHGLWPERTELRGVQKRREIDDNLGLALASTAPVKFSGINLSRSDFLSDKSLQGNNRRTYT